MQLNFNAAAVEPAKPNQVIPAGVYTMMMTQSEVKPTSNAQGTLIAAGFKILDEGEYKGRMVFTNFNIANPNPQAEQIGQSQFSGLCHAANVIQVQDTEQLHGIPVRGKVSIQKDRSGQYEDRNDIRVFEPVGNAQAGGQASGGFFQQQPQGQPVQQGQAPQQTPAANQQPVQQAQPQAGKPSPWNKG